MKIVETRADLAVARRRRRTADRAVAAGRLRPGDAEPLLDVLATGRAERVA